MTFSEFFEAAWRKEPFPWQKRLAERALRGEWPSIGLPTAAGKTAVIDIAVYALAMGAPRAARRIFFVVDRRVIVDEAAERAAKLAEMLSKAELGSPLGQIAQALRKLGGGPNPLETAVLRGGIPRDGSWMKSPIQPLVVCSTVDQVGSSLLFRSYETSEYGRPIRAGLAALDSLIILDEAHTSQPFAESLERIRTYRGWAVRHLDLPFTVVEMSATPRNGDVLREDAEDCTNEVLQKRWNAEKRARMVEVKSGEEGKEAVRQGIAEALAREARSMRDERGARVIGVIANRVQTARDVYNALSGDSGSRAALLTGRARAYDRDRIWEEWSPMIGLDRGTDAEVPVFVVATQCIEVGANLDFDALVTEVASIDALEQRFGRLDRNGNKGLTYAAIVAHKEQTGSKHEDPVYGRALPAVWKWLKDHVKRVERTEEIPAEGKKKAKVRKVREEFVAMGVLDLRQALADTDNREALITPRKNAPVLMPAHMDLLCQTSPEPALSPEPSLFLHGPDTGPADVEVVWRADFGEDPSKWRETAAVCPPSAAEAMSLPVWVVRNWLSNQQTAEVADVEGSREDNGRVPQGGRPFLVWRGSDDSEDSRDPRKIKPGTTVMVPAAYGGCDEWGWNPLSEKDATDIGDPVKLLMGRPMLRLHPKLAEGWKYADLARRLGAAESIAEARSILASSAPDSGSAPWLIAAVKTLQSGRLKFIGDSAITGRGSFDQDSAGSSFTSEVPLGLHLDGCEQLAARFAEGLPAALKETIRRAAALHDIGKADPRFQSWLRGGNPVRPQELIAKSRRSAQNRAAVERARELAGYPKGGRHELLSTALLQDHRTEFDGLDFDLLLHLLASHHGRCRPFSPVVEDEDPVQVSYGHWQTSTEHRLERLNSGVSERFWRLTRRYGWYGLAYLETLVRLADQRQSEAEQEGAVEQAEVAHV